MIYIDNEKGVRQERCDPQHVPPLLDSNILVSVSHRDTGQQLRVYIPHVKVVRTDLIKHQR